MPHPDKCPHDSDVGFDGNWRVQDSAQHGDTLLCEFVGICNVQKTHIAFFFKPRFLENILDVFRNDASVALEQLRHLRLRQPDRHGNGPQQRPPQDAAVSRDDRRLRRCINLIAYVVFI